MKAQEDHPPVKGKILAVDDDPIVLRLLASQISRLAYQVTTADGGENALAILEKDTFDIMITDILMPGMNGLELMREAFKVQPDLQCLVVSGQGEIATAVEAMKTGAINYISKPLSLMELEVSLEKGMEKVRLLKQLQENQQALQVAAQELNNYRRHLERLVEERTAELAETNRQLELDIKARKKAEEEAESRRQQLIEADKLVSLGILVAGVAHEINNPNNFITMNTPILKRAWDDLLPIVDSYHAEHGDFPVAGIPYSEMRSHIPELFSGILDGSERIRKIVFNLRDYARQGVSDMGQLFEMNRVVNAALVLLASTLKKATNHLQVRYGEPLPQVRGNFQRAEQVIINLIQNAYQALPSPDKGISITTRHDQEKQQVIVEIKDEGCGIPPKNLKLIQDPFFTTKRDRGGSGLGLSISAGIMEEHGGRLDISSQPGQGTTVRAIFPAVTPPPEAINLS